MDDVRRDFLGPPHGTTPAAVIANNKKLLDPLEAVKHLKREDGPYCTISGNEPSSVTLNKTGSESQTIWLQFQEFPSE